MTLTQVVRRPLSVRSKFTKTPGALTAVAWVVAVIAGVLLIALVKHLQSQKKSVSQVLYGKSLTEPQAAHPAPANRAKAAEVTLDQTSSLAEIRAKADQGNAVAQRLLGMRYINGEGIPRDATAAVEWWRKAAAQGDIYAQHNLAVCFDKGEGVARDDVEAVRWYRLAADGGCAESQCAMGWRCATGDGVTEDKVAAVKWYGKAAEHGYSEAQWRLGDCYFEGEGVTKDFVEATKWFRLAAQQGHAEAQWKFALACLSGVGTKKDEIEGMKWCRKAAEQGEIEAQKHLAAVLFTKEKDLVESAKWFRKAADQGDLGAQVSFGMACLHGHGVQKDEAEGLRLIRTAAENGYAEAQYELGMHLSARPSGIESEFQEGVQWLREAAEQGLHIAQVVLGAVYSDPEAGGPKDYVEAYMWCSLAAKNQNESPLLAERLAQLEKEMTPLQLHQSRLRILNFEPSTKSKRPNVSEGQQAPASTIIASPVQDEVKNTHLNSDLRLQSGTILMDSLAEHGGKGRLILDNGLTEDAYVKLISGDKLWASFYVRGGEKFTFDHVPDAKYHLLYCTGFGWITDRRDFARGRHAVRYDEVLDYSTTQRTEGGTVIVSTGVITLTLHKVANGNTKTSDIPLEEFDRY